MVTRVSTSDRARPRRAKGHPVNGGLFGRLRAVARQIPFAAVLVAMVAGLVAYDPLSETDPTAADAGVLAELQSLKLYAPGDFCGDGPQTGTHSECIACILQSALVPTAATALPCPWRAYSATGPVFFATVWRKPQTRSNPARAPPTQSV